MCSVSAIHDYFQKRTTPDMWNFDSLNQFQDIIRRLEALDENLGQKDCVDPAKAEWMKAIEDRIRKLERTAGVAYEE